MEGKRVEQSTQYLKMTQTPIPKLILKLSIPTTISMLVSIVNCLLFAEVSAII